MKKLESFILRACAYTVLLTLILYIALALSGLAADGVPFLKFLLVLGYGILIAGANLLHSELKIKPLPKRLIHFAMLLIGFITVYLLNGSTPSVNAGHIFIAVVMFTIFYVIIGLAVKGIGILIHKSDSKMGASAPKEKREKPAYKSRFGDN